MLKFQNQTVPLFHVNVTMLGIAISTELKINEKVKSKKMLKST